MAQKQSRKNATTNSTNWLLESLKRLAAGTDSAPSQETLAVYMDRLMHETVEDIDRGIQRTLDTWFYAGKFPPLGVLLHNMQHPEDQLLAEQSWVIFVAICKRYWHPDIGFTEDCPKLNAAAKYAMETVGGPRRFAQTKIADEQFVRKEFIEAYLRFRETKGLTAATRHELDSPDRRALPLD